ncbi:MAG: hypothetical protein AAGI25_13555 [Bacteroidota bacterium]
MPEDPNADHILIYGGNGTKGNLPGDNFKIQFDATVKLYNNGLSNKTVIVGDTSFVLESHKFYYLIGDITAPELKDYNYEVGRGSEPGELLEGDFSMLRINQ